MPGDWHPEKSEDGLKEDGHQHKIARSAEHRRGVGEDEGADNITRRLLRHTQQRGQRNLLRLTFEYFEDGHAFNAFFVEHLLKDRGLADTEPDPQTDRDHDNAEKKRYPPSPNQKLSPESQLKNSTARFARNSPAGPPNCGQAARKPRFL